MQILITIISYWYIIIKKTHFTLDSWPYSERGVFRFNPPLRKYFYTFFTFIPGSYVFLYKVPLKIITIKKEKRLHLYNFTINFFVGFIMNISLIGMFQRIFRTGKIKNDVKLSELYYYLMMYIIKILYIVIIGIIHV